MTARASDSNFRRSLLHFKASLREKIVSADNEVRSSPGKSADYSESAAFLIGSVKMRDKHRRFLCRAQ